MRHTPVSGFTLIELSIVLVIVGLLVGGILVGRDLIEAAAIRGTISQINQYKTAVNTFALKFGGLPGDLPGPVAGAFGLAVMSGSPAPGIGDGNGLLEACSASAVGTATIANCETLTFWDHLIAAGLMKMEFAENDEAAFPIISNALASVSQSTVPRARIKNGNAIIVYADGGINYFEITGLLSPLIGGGVYSLFNALTPAQVNVIDTKMDDGKPLSGIITATEGTGPDIAAVAGAAKCVFTGGQQYNTTTSTLAGSPLCHVRLRMN